MITTILDTMQTLEEEEAVISTTSMSSLPEDIQVDIFTKLPLKSISMSRCVCKLWYNLLSTSKFIKYHLNHNNIQNKKINHKLISITRGSYSIYSTAYDSVSSSPLPSFNKTLKVDMVEILGSCDGLACLGINGYVIGIVNSRYYRICIWNPLTREYKQVLVKSHFQENIVRHFLLTADDIVKRVWQCWVTIFVYL
ncbi:hypothetical protein MKW98_013431 [Papaver atlanticum]|uniref:F-box domain-containing protein n=1 Tax=Papaver atlanticum TaxID=357466 RepID=A0AAD4XK76_9MAGN|nr:hypothetical protein MKW98_013431 [Papaver atlanticum]